MASVQRAEARAGRMTVELEPMRKLALGGLVAGVAWSFSPVQLGLACPLLSATGVPCPACGMTRSFEALAHGHVLESLTFNPAGLVLVLGAVAVLVARRVPRLDIPTWSAPAGLFVLALWNIALNPTFSG